MRSNASDRHPNGRAVDRQRNLNGGQFTTLAANADAGPEPIFGACCIDGDPRARPVPADALHKVLQHRPVRVTAEVSVSVTV